jgi:DNA-binding transcriptional MerR regulator
MTNRHGVIGVSGVTEAQFDANNVLTHTISDLAREFGVTLRTLRFYEDKGLLAPRREGQTRRYDDRDRDRLALILKGKKLGFTLAEIRALVEQADMSRPGLALSAAALEEQIAMLERQRREIDEALAELRHSYQALSSGPGPS